MRGATAEFTCDACGPPDDGRSMAPRVPSLAQSLGVYDLREGGGCKKHGRWGSRRSTMAARPRWRPSPVNKKRAVVKKNRRQPEDFTLQIISHSMNFWRVKPSQSLAKIIEKNINIYDIK